MDIRMTQCYECNEDVLRCRHTYAHEVERIGFVGHTPPIKVFSCVVIGEVWVWT